MNCVICKNGTCQTGRVTVKLERENSIVLIKNVKAMVCNNCGHYYLDEKNSKLVMEKAENALEKGAELEVLTLKAA